MKIQLMRLVMDSTGSIDITTTGGNWPYTYLWSNGSTTEDLRAIPTGNYSCTISENRGCSIVTQTYFIQNSSGSFQFDNIDIDHESCSNMQGEIILNMEGGLSPYAYNWNTGDTSNYYSKPIFRNICGYCYRCYRMSIRTIKFSCR